MAKNQTLRGPPMSSVLLDLVILVVAGLVGGYAAGFAGKEHSLGTIKNCIVGIIGGAGSYFLLPFIPPTVGSAGENAVEHAFTLALLGLAAGGILAFVVGFVVSEAFKHRSP